MYPLTTYHRSHEQRILHWPVKLRCIYHGGFNISLPKRDNFGNRIIQQSCMRYKIKHLISTDNDVKNIVDDLADQIQKNPHKIVDNIVENSVSFLM